jgi:hypothetical protein
VGHITVEVFREIGRRKRLKRRVLMLVGAPILAAVFFSWGFLTHRNEAFPYALARSAAERVGLIVPDTGTLVKEVLPATPRLSALRSLPYLQSLPDQHGDRSGVVVHDPERAMAGVNFYNSYGRSAAHLIDMNGQVLHEWSYPYREGDWFHAELMTDGAVLVVVENEGLLKIDKESRLLWSFESRVHHGLAVEDGDIFLLVSEPVLVPEIHPTAAVLDERITVVSGDGIKKTEISLLQAIRASSYAFLLPTARQLDLEGVDQLDLLHANHVEVFDGSRDHLSPLFRRGNILVSLKHLNVIAILDGTTHEILWLWGPNNLALQHHPVLLENGRILLFDNGTEESRVLELDVPTGTVTWHYEADEFFSEWGGSNQRLENGNTLITNSATGYVHEVTPEGEIVWSFANPEFDEEGRFNIWRMTRFSRDRLDFLGEAEEH